MMDDPKRILEPPTPQEEKLFERLNDQAGRLIAADTEDANSEKTLFEVLMIRRVARLEDSQKRAISLLEKVLGYVRQLHDADKTLAQASTELRQAGEAWKKMYGSPLQ